MKITSLLVVALLCRPRTSAEDSLPPLHDRVPSSVQELWQSYDPRTEPLETEVIREWRDGGVTIRAVRYRIGQFRGKKSVMAAFYGFPSQHEGKLPGVLQIHGGGQRASLRAVRDWAARGYAVLSVNWGGREMELAEAGDPGTDWGAVDPTQNNVAGYSSILPGPKTIDDVESPRNNNWFLLTIGCRRGITFLAQQNEVDALRIGVWGHSMGGRLTGLVAGTDTRVRVASPSVGGTGFLQTDFAGVPGSARRVRGSLDLFQKTLAGQAYLAEVECPLLFLSATNDFNAPMEFVCKGVGLIPHSNKRTVFSVHLNHRFTPNTDVSRKLWFDAHLQERLPIPQSPQVALELEQPDGIPRVRVTADQSRPIRSVRVYYGYERDPRNRFWASCELTLKNGVWSGKCPVFDPREPLLVLANVHYVLREKERYVGDPAEFVLSATASATPQQLQAAPVLPSGKHNRLIDDFSHGWRDWYVLNGSNPHHWEFATRKPVDPRWQGPRGGKLTFRVFTTEPRNTLAIRVEVDAWRGYARRQRREYKALLLLPERKENYVELFPAAFTDENGDRLKSWDGVTQLTFQPGGRAAPEKDLGQWKGQIPRLEELRWVGGKVVPHEKPWPVEFSSP